MQKSVANVGVGFDTYGEDRITCGWIRARYLGGSVDLVLLNGRFTPLLSSRSRWWWCYRTMPNESLKCWVRSRDVHVWYSLQSMEEIQTHLALSPDHAASARQLAFAETLRCGLRDDRMGYLSLAFPKGCPRG